MLGWLDLEAVAEPWTGIYLRVLAVILYIRCTGACPQHAGFWGHVAGWIMACRPSNRQRNARTVDLLNPQLGQSVLEIGVGPGLALQRAAARVGDQEFVAGIDASGLMLAEAARRNGPDRSRDPIRIG